MEIVGLTKENVLKISNIKKEEEWIKDFRLKGYESFMKQDNPSFGPDVKLDYDKIVDARFDGEACAICTSAVSIMIKKVIGKTIKEAEEIITNYQNMINEKEYDKDLLGELNVYDEIYLQPNRKNCALLPSKAIINIIKIYEDK